MGIIFWVLFYNAIFYYLYPQDRFLIPVTIDLLLYFPNRNFLVRILFQNFFKIKRISLYIEKLNFFEIFRYFLNNLVKKIINQKIMSSCKNCIRTPKK